MLCLVATTSAPRSPFPECSDLAPGAVNRSREREIVGLIIEADMRKLNDFEDFTALQ